MTIKRVRREYGAPCKFVDRNVADAKGAYQECVSYEDKQFDMRKIELETATQVHVDHRYYFNIIPYYSNILNNFGTNSKHCITYW